MAVFDLDILWDPHVDGWQLEHKTSAKPRGKITDGVFTGSIRREVFGFNPSKYIRFIVCSARWSQKSKRFKGQSKCSDYFTLETSYYSYTVRNVGGPGDPRLKKRKR